MNEIKPGAKTIGRFHVLTDFHFQQRYSHSELARMAIDGGADTIQFRQKRGEIRHLIHEASSVARVGRECGVPILINDRVDVLLAVQADGAHLGQTDFPVADARRIVGDQRIIGTTATTLAQARRAEADGADYIGFGPIYPTTSKANPASSKGLGPLAEVVREVGIPVIAIAGISADRVPEVLGTGAHGVAVMSAVTLAPDAVRAAHEIRRAIDSFLENR